MLIVITTAPNQTEAEELAEKLVTAKLAACVQILPPMTSVYVWEGKLQKESEHLLLIKTLSEKWDALTAFVAADHSYEVPVLVAFDAANEAEPYRAWLDSVLKA